MSLLNFIEFKILGDNRGSLVSLEENINIPFSIKRVYYIFNTQENVSRGFHSHKNLKQVVICLTGSCRFILDNGREKQEVWLDSPSKGLFIEGSIWREMHDFSEDCILLVLASEHFDESDYVRDYNEFIRQTVI